MTQRDEGPGVRDKDRRQRKRKKGKGTGERRRKGLLPSGTKDSLCEERKQVAQRQLFIKGKRKLCVRMRFNFE